MSDTAIVPVTDEEDDVQEEMKIETYTETFDCLVEMKIEVIGLDGQGLVSINADESLKDKKRNAARDACAKATEMVTDILKPIADKLNPENGSIRITFIGSTKAAPSSTRIDREELKKQLNDALIEQAGLKKDALQKKFDDLKNKAQAAGQLPPAADVNATPADATDGCGDCGNAGGCDNSGKCNC